MWGAFRGSCPPLHLLPPASLSPPDPGSLGNPGEVGISPTRLLAGWDAGHAPSPRRGYREGWLALLTLRHLASPRS